MGNKCHKAAKSKKISETYTLSEKTLKGAANENLCPVQARSDLTFNEYFMSLAAASSKKSKDPVTKVGACIVNEATNRVMGLGYNGFPNGCPDDKLPWHKSDNYLDCKHAFVCHAELNAVMNMERNPHLDSLIPMAIYVTLFPCNFCAQIIIQAGIKRVVYHCERYLEKPSGKAAAIMFNLAGVKYEKYKGKTSFSVELVD